MSQSNPTKFGTESWKRMSAILLVAVMVLMMAMPMVSAAPAETTVMLTDKWDTSGGTGIAPTPEALTAHKVKPLETNTRATLMSAPTPRPWAILDYYTDRPTFDTAAPGLPVEDFENHLIGPNAV